MNKNHGSVGSTFSTIKRRKMLGFISGTAVVSLLGCQRQQSTAPQPAIAQTESQTVAQATDLPTCVVKPQQTEGPYFVDEALNRSDIRAGKAGVPLKLVLRVSQVNAGACSPLPEAVVDIWHCDAEGMYSDVRDRSFDTVGQTFLRGSQVTDTNGTVEFVTIYPGWYRGRTAHIHFKIRGDAAAQQGFEFTSQLYFDDALSDQVYAQAPYNNRGQQDTKNNRDRIFQDGGDQLTLQLTPTEEGYISTFDIGLDVA
ncbi:MAG: intradiol ring-cleavage dioxygenase [Thainema sp.]